MSILFEALQKAKTENEKKAKTQTKPDPQDIIDQIKKFEEETQAVLSLSQKKQPLQFKVDLNYVFLLIGSTFLIAGLVFFFAKEPSEQIESIPTQVKATTQSSDPVITNRRSNPTSPVIRSDETAETESASPRIRNIVIQQVAKIPPADLQVPEFKLTGIMSDSAGRYCFLNNLIARQGDTIDGAEILQIGERGVLLDFRGTQLEVPLPEI